MSIGIGMHTSRLLPVLPALLALVLPTMAHADREAVKNAKSWSYQLQGDIASTKRRNSDVAVLDPDHVRDPGSVKRKPDGGKRAVLAYISVGEAEEGREYMKRSGKKSWNTGQTQGWSGNYAVRYWDEEWKSIVKNRVKKALDAGYDGVYLDRVDTYEKVKAPKDSRRAMQELVREVASTARGRKSDAAVIVQNGEELLKDKDYVKSIDGIAKESLYYGVKGKGVRNSDGDIKASRELLKKAKSEGKSVYVVEYVNGSKKRSASDEVRKDGFVPTTADRDLKGRNSDDD